MQTRAQTHRDTSRQCPSACSVSSARLPSRLHARRPSASALSLPPRGVPALRGTLRSALPFLHARRLTPGALTHAHEGFSLQALRCGPAHEGMPNPADSHGDRDTSSSTTGRPLSRPLPLAPPSSYRCTWWQRPSAIPPSPPCASCASCP